VSLRRLHVLVVSAVTLALLVPAASLADHIVTAANVSARLKERRSADFWTVEINWGGFCNGAAAGKAWFGGDIYLIDVDTGERIYVGGVVSTSGERIVSGTRDWFVSSIERPRRLFPELTLSCYENFPLHGGRAVTVTGTSVLASAASERVGRVAAAAEVAATATAAASAEGLRDEPRRSWGRTTRTR
jgi:hypothetical protein